MPHDDTADLQEIAKKFMYSSLSLESQWSMAETYCLKNGCWIEVDGDGNKETASNKNLKKGHFDKAREIAEAEQEGSWEKLSSEKKNIAAWIQMLVGINARIDIVPVEFVDYDEALYKKLVESGANNGEVATEEKELGPL